MSPKNVIENTNGLNGSTMDIPQVKSPGELATALPKLEEI
jgi:hypothetical protein